DRGLEILAAPEHLEDQLLVLAALAAGEELEALQRGRLDPPKPIAAIDGQDLLGGGIAELDLRRQDVPHAARGRRAHPIRHQGLLGPWAVRYSPRSAIYRSAERWMRSRSAGVTWRFTRAGAPISTLPRGTSVPGETTAPAATRHSSSSTTPSRTMAPMPMRQWDLIWQPCRRAAWPTVTNSSMTEGVPPRLTWTMVPSWILVPRPTRMKFTSPRSTAVNQTLVSSASSTSPITWEEDSTKAVGCSLGRTPRYGWSRPLLLRHGHDDLRLARGAGKDAAEADHRRHQRGLNAVLGTERAERGDPALEAGVDGLQAIAGGSLEHHRQQALPDLVLGNDQLLDPVTVQIHRERGGLDLVELALATLSRARNDQLHLDVA